MSIVFVFLALVPILVEVRVQRQLKAAWSTTNASEERLQIAMKEGECRASMQAFSL